MDKKKRQKGRILRKVWIKRKDRKEEYQGKYGIQKERKERKNTKESMDRKKGRKGRILSKVWIERKERKEEYK